MIEIRFFDFLNRKILNDLSSDTPAVPRIEEEKNEEESTPAITTVTVPTPIYQTSSGQYSEWDDDAHFDKAVPLYLNVTELLVIFN